MPTRPLSPHLQIYRWQLTSVLSILHRLTGIALALGMFLLIYWLIAVAAGPEAYDAARGIIGSFLGRLVLLGWTWALLYHFCNGLRHLLWDAGHGLELRHTYASGWAVVAAAFGLTLVVWIVAYATRGGS